MNKRTFVLGLACVFGVIGSLYGDDFSANKKKALMYYSEKDFDAAYEYCIKSDPDDPEIQQRLAWMYSTGNGVQKNMSKAIDYSKKAADAGNGTSALYYAVWSLLPQKKFDDALKYLQIAEKANNSYAICLIGGLYENGYVGNGKDIQKAIEYYRKACECPDPVPIALVTLGAKIQISEPSFAMDCWKRAAKKDYAEAYLMLGQAFHFGVAGAKIDYSIAINHYKKAIELADKKIGIEDKEQAGQLAIRCYSLMADIYSEHFKDYVNAIGCLQNTLKYATINKTFAGEHLRKIALLYWEQQQWSDAYKYLEKSVEYGNGLAYVDLGIMHAKAKGIPKDLKKAKEFFEKAMAAGHSEGFIQMGIMYMEGEGVAYNEAKAEECFKRAIEIDKNHRALSWLAKLYLQQNKANEAMRIILAAKKSDEACAQFDVLLAQILERGTAEVDRSLISNLRNTLENEVKKGNPAAAYYLSRYLDSGILGIVDEKRSQQLLHYASEHGVCCASCLLAQKRIHVAKPSTDDIQFAYQYAKKALKQNPNCTSALFLLGTGALSHSFWENPQAGMEYLTEAANKNTPQAALILGLRYSSEKNYAKARYYLNIAQREPQLHTFIQNFVLWFDMTKAIDENNINTQKELFAKVKKAAEEGFFPAWNMLALCYEGGFGTPIDTQKAKFWFEKFLNFKGDPRFNADLRDSANKHLQKGMDILKSIEDPAKSFEWNQKLANQGDAGAQYAVGMCYEKGRGVAKDPAKAFEWYLKSANQGFADAQCAVGMCYQDGSGVTQDPAKAFDWFRKSANQSNALAQYAVGMCYEKGIGVTQDPAKAFDWYQKSADQGFADAQFYVGVCYANGFGVSKDLKKAFDWYQKSANQGNANAQNNVGACYQNCLGVAKDPAKAFEWYRKAADQGDATAQYNVGFCYHKGIGIAQDLEKAFDWYQKAADRGFTDAQCMVGLCYQAGIGVAQDSEKAFEWYQKAADQGDATAQYYLGFCYQAGIGVAQDLEKAFDWYQKAAEQGDKNAESALKKLQAK